MRIHDCSVDHQPISFRINSQLSHSFQPKKSFSLPPHGVSMLPYPNLEIVFTFTQCSRNTAPKKVRSLHEVKGNQGKFPITPNGDAKATKSVRVRRTGQAISRQWEDWAHDLKHPDTAPSRCHQSDLVPIVWQVPHGPHLDVSPLPDRTKYSPKPRTSTR